MKNQLTSLYFSLRDFVEPLRVKVSSLEALEYLFYRYGWEISLDEATFNKVNQGLALKIALEQFLSVVGPLQQKLDDTPDSSLSVEDVAKIAASADTLIRALAELNLSSLTDLAPPLGDPQFWASISDHLINDLLEEYLRIYRPNMYLALHFGGAIRYELTQPAAPFRRAYSRIVFDWEQVLALVKDPLAALKQNYKWGDSDKPFEYQRFLTVLANVLRAIHLSTSTFAPSLRTNAGLLTDSLHQVQTDVDGLRTTFLDNYSPRDQVVYEMGIELFPAAKAGETSPSGLILSPILRGGAGGDLPFGESFSMRWKAAASADDAIGVVIFPDKIDLIQGLLAVGGSLEFVGTRTEPWYLLGNAHTARIEIYSPSIRLSVEGTVDDPETKLHLSTAGANSQPGARVVIPLDDADGFVQEAVKEKALELSFSPEVIWSSKTGLAFNRRANVDIDLPLNLSIGEVRVQRLLLRLAPKNDGNDAILEFEASAGLGITLGPVDASMDRVGFLLTLDFVRKDKNFGFVDISFGFKPPNGVGLSIDEAGVTGGGFLYLDAEKGQYAGVVQLNLEGGIAVKALGLIATRLPNNAKGFSLLVIITAEDFKPIPLPLGFKLTGIGGLLAINRTFDVEALRAGLKNNALDSVMFPKDPIRNAPQILSNLNKVFPSANGHHLFGPMAQITWGAPPLITANLGLVMELGARLRMLILAQIAAILPRRENDLVRLQMDAIGVLDFDQGRAELDATLHDSRLLKKFTLTGEMAMRLKWEGSPSFALAVGGLHPAFNPPPNFPKLERIAINLSAGDNPRLRCEAYFALTSNTVQFGARAELYASALGFSIQGEIGFDVLIQIDPFQFLAEFHAQVQLKRGQTNLFKVRVEGALEGPRPLRIKAKATFEVLWWDVSIRIDKTLVEGEKPPLPEPIDVMPRLKEALANPGAWIAQLPGGQRPMVTLRAKTGAATDVLLHPLGTLTVKQSVVPLNMDISRFGQAAPAGVRRFTISGVSLGGLSQTTQPVKDFFAPAQFFEMSDDEKLSRPSFEPLTAGVNIGSSEFVFTTATSDWLEVEAIEFETWIVDKQKNEIRRSNPEDTKKLYKLNPEPLGRQARFGAAGVSDLRRTGKAKYRTTAPKHRIAKEGWSIVATDDLTVQPAPGVEAGKSMSYSEAAQALRKLKQENPAIAADLKILRPSEVSEE